MSGVSFTTLIRVVNVETNKKINNKLSQIRHVNVGGKTVNFDVFKSHEGTRRGGGGSSETGKAMH